MKRRPTAATVASRPIAFWSHRFFLVVIHDVPRLTLGPPSSPAPPAPLHLPQIPGIEFIELETTLLEPLDGRETHLDAAHTIRFCRFLNATRRQHESTKPRGFGRPHEVHFVARSHEASVVELVVRWRLLCLELSPVDALAPFGSHHISSQALGGIAKGVAANLLFSPRDFQRDDETEDTKETVDTSLIRITARFVLFAGPINAPTAPSMASDVERPPTVDHTIHYVRSIDDLSTPSRLSVAELVPLLKQRNVAMVVKLNSSPRYDDQLIVRSLIEHLDLSSQSDHESLIDRSVVARFLESCEHASSQRVVAVHSVTGRGRAAFCIACFLIKHAQFTAVEAMAWVRFCCPDALPVWFEQPLRSMESALVRDGDAFRRRQDERASPSPRSLITPRRLSRGTLDDLALVPSQISLLGTMAKDKPSLKRLETKHSGATVVPLPRTATAGSGSFRELVATDAVLSRRPRTQGSSTTRRRLVDHSHIGSFATLHKFLHQSTAPSSSSPSRPTS